MSDQIKQRGPRRFTASELARVGMVIIDLNKGHIGCKHCGDGGLISLRPGGRREHGWWRCPRGCNAKSY